MKQTADWITSGSSHPFLTRKKFHSQGKVIKATVTSCGLGQYNLYFNGQRTNDHVLDPAWTDYRKYVQYVTDDVTDLIQEGENVIAAEIGNGWFIKDDFHYTFHFPPFMPPNPNPYKPFGNSLIFDCRLTIEYADDRTKVICSDDSWAVHDHWVKRSNVYGSEQIDHRYVIEKWNEVSCMDEDWPKAQYATLETLEQIDQFQPAIKVIRTTEAKKIREDVYDLGANGSYMLEITAVGKPGDIIHVFPAEKLDENGNPDQFAKGWVNIDVCSEFILGSQEEETFCSTFAYMAGRYLRIEADTCTNIISVKAHYITSAWRDAGSFHCDDERLNSIYQMIERTVEANMVGVHTDCPLIERFAWQEPNHLLAPAMMYMKDIRHMFEKIFLDLRYSAHSADDYFNDLEGGRYYPGEGLVPSQAPCYIPMALPGPGMGSFYDTIAWGSTCILGVYHHYMFYDDKKVIKENYAMGIRYIRHLLSKLNADGFINHGLGDWGNPDQLYARENVETAFLYGDIKTMLYLASEIENDDDTEWLEESRCQILANYNDKLLKKDPETGLYGYRIYGEDHKVSQAAQALPLYFGMVPDAQRNDVLETFRQILVHDGSFRSGEIGLPYIIQTAAQNGMNDLITDFILKPEHPSYYAFIKEGETTLGEYWETNPRSHCHDMMGHIIEWYFNGLAGIRLLLPGFKEITVRPYLPESVHNMQCTYHSMQGKITVRLEKNETGTELYLSVPKEIKYTVCTDELTNCHMTIEVNENA